MLRPNATSQTQATIAREEHLQHFCPKKNRLLGQKHFLPQNKPTFAAKKLFAAKQTDFCGKKTFCRKRNRLLRQKKTLRQKSVTFAAKHFFGPKKRLVLGQNIFLPQKSVGFAAKWRSWEAESYNSESRTLNIWTYFAKM
jgi:hypothetical protein